MDKRSFFKKLLQGAAVIAVSPSVLAEIGAKSTQLSVTNAYLAGYQTTFSKQMLSSLPFLQEQLPKMLTRDFYKKENDILLKSLHQS